MHAKPPALSRQPASRAIVVLWRRLDHGSLPINVEIRASAAGRWTLNGEEQSKVSGCLDVDLAFTPATNLLPLRRLMLKAGQEAEAPAAYLNLRQERLTVLQQTYLRLSRREYRYEAPQFDYSETLQMSDVGVVLHYPGLFEAVCGRLIGHRSTGAREEKRGQPVRANPLNFWRSGRETAPTSVST